MPVDVRAEIEIGRPGTEVAAFAADPPEPRRAEGVRQDRRPFVPAAMRRANRKHVSRLEQIVESQPPA